MGERKRHKRAEHRSPVALRLRHAIKGALDPYNTMNPGKVLETAPTPN